MEIRQKPPWRSTCFVLEGPRVGFSLVVKRDERRTPFFNEKSRVANTRFSIKERGPPLAAFYYERKTNARAFEHETCGPPWWFLSDFHRPP